MSSSREAKSRWEGPAADPREPGRGGCRLRRRGPHRAFVGKPSPAAAEPGVGGRCRPRHSQPRRRSSSTGTHSWCSRSRTSLQSRSHSVCASRGERTAASRRATPSKWLADDLLQQHPSIVVLAFSGNSLTDCMRDERSELLSGDGLVAKYRDDLERSVSLATQADVPVVLGVTTGIRRTTPAAGSGSTRCTATSPPPAAPHVQYTNAGTDIAPAGTFSANQRCLPFEVRISNGGCANNETGVSVRAADGVHFCAASERHDLERPSCREYSSGALRYAIALMSAAAPRPRLPRRHGRPDVSP